MVISILPLVILLALAWLLIWGIVALIRQGKISHLLIAVAIILAVGLVGVFTARQQTTVTHVRHQDGSVEYSIERTYQNSNVQYSVEGIGQSRVDSVEIQPGEVLVPDTIDVPVEPQPIASDPSIPSEPIAVEWKPSHLMPFPADLYPSAESAVRAATHFSLIGLLDDLLAAGIHPQAIEIHLNPQGQPFANAVQDAAHNACTQWQASHQLTAANPTPSPPATSPANTQPASTPVWPIPIRIVEVPADQAPPEPTADIVRISMKSFRQWPTRASVHRFDLPTPRPGETVSRNAVAQERQLELPTPSDAPNHVEMEAWTRQHHRSSNLRFVDAPWVENRAAWQPAQPGSEWILATSNTLCPTPDQAERQARQFAQRAIVDRLIHTVRSQGFQLPSIHWNNFPDRTWCEQRVRLALDNNTFETRSFRQAFQRPYGQVHRAALLIAVPQAQLTVFANEAYERTLAHSENWAAKLRSAGGLVLVMVVLYVLLNSLTRGYFTWPIRISVAAMLIVGIGAMLLFA